MNPIGFGPVALHFLASQAHISLGTYTIIELALIIRREEIRLFGRGLCKHRAMIFHFSNPDNWSYYQVFIHAIYFVYSAGWLTHPICIKFYEMELFSLKINALSSPNRAFIAV
jgi:hypothetical protein